MPFLLPRELKESFLGQHPFPKFFRCFILQREAARATLGFKALSTGVFTGRLLL